MSDWEDELDNMQEETAKEEQPVEKKEILEENEEIVKQVKVVEKKVAAEKEKNYEDLYQEKMKDKIKELEEKVSLMTHLTEDERAKKIEELKNLALAEDMVDDEKVKEAEFDHNTFKLEVEKDFIDYAFKIAKKFKQSKKPSEQILFFLKKINLKLNAEFNSDNKHELISSIDYLINNKKKGVAKKDKEQPKPKVETKKLDIDNIEINPDYKPRNAALYDDFM